MSQKEHCFECEGYGYITEGIQCDYCKGKGFILKSHSHNKKSKKDEYRSKQREKSRSKWEND